MVAISLEQKDFLLRLGDALADAAITAQGKYDSCTTQDQFMSTQIARIMLVERIPGVISDIVSDTHDEDFDFIEWYEHMRGIELRQKAPSKWYINLLKRLLIKLSKNQK